MSIALLYISLTSHAKLKTRTLSCNLYEFNLICQLASTCHKIYFASFDQFGKLYIFCNFSFRNTPTLQNEQTHLRSGFPCSGCCSGLGFSIQVDRWVIDDIGVLYLLFLEAFIVCVKKVFFSLSYDHSLQTFAD